VIWGLGAALGWGLADLFAAFSGRRIGSWATLVLAQFAAAIVMAVVVVVLRPSWDGFGEVAPWLLGNTVFVVGAYLALYHALEVGRIAVISPVLASYAVIPVLLAVILLDESLSAVQIAAIAITILGAVLTSTDLRALREGTHTMPKGLPWAVAAAVLFGVATYTLGWAAQHASPVPVLWLTRTSAAVVFAVGALFFRVRRGFALTRRPLPLAALGLAFALGSVDVGGTLSYVHGASVGLVSIVTAVSATYPLIPVFGGIKLFGEWPSTTQYAGVAMVVAGLVLLGFA
jgi:drug/metabolite transporter (DMT)-like permease